ncbi:MAG: serine/threonine-protein kinase [Pirellulales bacterium]
MSTTTFHQGAATLAFDGQEPATHCPEELLERYDSLIDGQRMSWTEHLHLTRRLGSGGQGVVYLSQRRGTDNFTLPVALKIFSPARYDDARSYDEAMERIAQIAALVAQIQQDNLLDVHNFVERSRIRIMEMEWVDGYDLSQLLTSEMLERTRERVSNRRWEQINSVVVTQGPVQPRLKPGVAIAVVRECLAALAALHREGIVHGDLKPSNIMLKRTGNAKIVDIGSAFELTNAPIRRTCTPTYAAPEVLEGADCSPRSDLASLGYVLIEVLAGQPVFAGLNSYRDLLEAKRLLPQNLPDILPREVGCNELLMNFCRGLVAPDPMRRFANAEAADLMKEGAASFHRQLIKGDLASEYENEIRVWLEELE